MKSATDKPVAGDILVVEKGRTVVVCVECERTIASGPSDLSGIGVLLGHCGCRYAFPHTEPRALADSSREGEG